MKDTPNKQPFIDITERNYINASTRTTDPAPPIQWWNVITSMPFLAILLAHTAFNWGWYTILVGTTTYVEQVFHFDIKDNSIASVPLFTMWVFSLVVGRLWDTLCAKETVTTTRARKAATFISLIVPAICLLVLCFAPHDMLVIGIILGIGKFIKYWTSSAVLISISFLFTSNHVSWSNVQWFLCESHRHRTKLCCYIDGNYKYCCDSTRIYFTIFCGRNDARRCKIPMNFFVNRVRRCDRLFSLLI